MPMMERPGQLGIPLGPYGERSPYEKAVRWRRDTKTPETGSSFTPLADSVGTITPSSLHYERHHAGIPTIDPAQHRLVIHGMVDRPLSLTVAEIRRLPSVSRTLVLECGGNSGSEWAAKNGPDVQRSYGLASCSEWTGVPAVTAAYRSRRPARGGLGDRRRRGRLPDGAQHPDCESDGQHPARVWTKRRSASSRARISAASDYSRVGGKCKCEMAAQSEAHRSGLHGPGRNREVHGSDAGRHGADLYVSNGSEIGDHVSIGRAGVAGPRSL